MSTFELETISPHTIKKLEIVEKYVDNWARKILNFPKSNGIVFIDCFSNCGLYKNKEGEEIEGTAPRIAKIFDSLVHNPAYKEKTIIAYFNDIDKLRLKHLGDLLAKYKDRGVKIETSNLDADTFLKNFDLDDYNNNLNFLLFYDPFQATIDWDAVEPFLNTWGEVIINHMISDSLRGVAQTKREKTKKKYEKTYDTDFDDLTENNKETFAEKVKQIIEKRTENSRGDKFISSFPFFITTNVVAYHLIHFSHHIKGMNLFKTVAWQAFGGKSSAKNRKGKEMLINFLQDNDTLMTVADNDCYNVCDIAQYIYKKYKERDEVSFDEIYKDLDNHPIFPSEGFRNEIKSELKKLSGIEITRKTIRFNIT